MKLYLIRHAAAEERAADGRDAARALTAEGRRRFREIVHGLQRLDVRVERLVHSPARRACQTAELCLPLVEGELEVSDLLYAPPGEELLAALAGERVALVGHEPWLSELAFWLISGSHARSGGLGAALELEKGGLLELEGEPQPGGMTLLQALAPGTLRKLGRR